MPLQSILFAKDKWSVFRAIIWMREHGYQVYKIDTTHSPHFYRFRQLPPPFKHYTTKKIGNGVELVIGVN